MIRHVVVYQFQEQAEGLSKQQNMEDMRARLLALAGVVPELRRIEVGFNALHGAGSYDMALICDFDDLDALERYRVHPEHQKVAQCLPKVICGRAAVDFEF